MDGQYRMSLRAIQRVKFHIFLVLGLVGFTNVVSADYFGVMTEMATLQLKVADMRSAADSCDYLAQQKEIEKSEIETHVSKCNQFKSFMATQYKAFEAELVDTVDTAQAEHKAGTYHPEEWKKIQESMKAMITDFKSMREVIRKYH